MPGLRSYSVILAVEIGEPAAQVFHRVWYFCTRTDSGKVIDGRRWIVNSFPQWRKDHFPHWGLNTVKRAFQILTDRGLIHKENHNQAKQDRTLWYAVNFDHPLLMEAGYIDHKPSAQNGSMQKPKMGRCKDPKRADAQTQNGSMDRPKKSLSYKHRDHREDNQRRPSSSDDDGQLQKSQSKSRARGKRKEGDSVIPPPDPGDYLLKKVYGIVPPAVDFTTATPGEVHLMRYLRPFQNKKEMERFFPKELIRLMETPGPEALEAKCSEFVDRMLQDHFTAHIVGGIQTMGFRAVRGGFLNRCGFRAFCEREFYSERDAHYAVLDARTEVWDLS